MVASWGYEPLKRTPKDPKCANPPWVKAGCSILKMANRVREVLGYLSVCPSFSSLLYSTDLSSVFMIRLTSYLAACAVLMKTGSSESTPAASSADAMIHSVATSLLKKQNKNKHLSAGSRADLGFIWNVPCPVSTVKRCFWSLTRWQSPPESTSWMKTAGPSGLLDPPPIVMPKLLDRATVMSWITPSPGWLRAGGLKCCYSSLSISQWTNKNKDGHSLEQWWILLASSAQRRQEFGYDRQCLRKSSINFSILDSMLNHQVDLWKKGISNQQKNSNQLNIFKAEMLLQVCWSKVLSVKWSYEMSQDTRTSKIAGD